MVIYKYCDDVTPSNTANLNQLSVLFMGTDGDITITTVDGTDVTFTGVKAGTLLPVKAMKVLATGTTVTGIKALWGI